jgi:hypothetical protein
VATAVAQINGVDRAKLYEQLLAVAKKKTAEADVKLDDRGRPIEEADDLDLGDNCIIVPQVVPGEAAADAGLEPSRKSKGKPRKAKIATVEEDEPAAAAEAPKRRTAARASARAAKRASGKRGGKRGKA